MYDNATAMDSITLPVLIDIKINRFLIDDLIGRPWVFKTFDCLEVVRQLVQRITGKVIPAFEYAEDWYDKGFDYFSDHWRQLFDSTGFVLPGDILLFKLHRRVVNHIAVYIGEQKIVHSFQKTGVILSPFTTFARFFVAAGKLK